MKQFILGVAFLLIGQVFCGSAEAQNQYTWAGTGNFTATTGAFPLFSTPTYTVNGTAIDSISHPLRSHYATGISHGDLNSINYTVNLLKVAGSPTVTVSLWGSANYGKTYGTAPIYTYTASPSSTTVPVTNTYIVNGTANGGNPYSDYLWSIAGSASSTIMAQMDVLIR